MLHVVGNINNISTQKVVDHKILKKLNVAYLLIKISDPYSTL